MSRQTYTYQASAVPSRQSSNHGTSSAFSSSANPDEDWTQISDLAERRRIQNRIAQRNYRKKLKRRLEDLERRAASSSASPPQSHAELKPPSPKTRQPTTQRHAASSTRTHKAAPRDDPLPPSQYTPPMQADDEVYSHGFPERDSSRTPPLFSYHPYPPPDEASLYPTYTLAPPPYRALPADPYGEYLAPALPAMQHFNDALVKREDDVGGAFGMSFAAMAGLDIVAHQPYEDPHTPPLCHSFDHSAAGSEAGYHTYPGTPLSLPPSPRSLHL